MASAESAARVGRVITAITAVVGPDAPVEGIQIFRPSGGRVRVDLTTSVPGRLIGRRGATADALRARLADDLGMEVELNIQQARSEDPPPEHPEPPSGVREPRRPKPGDPSTGAVLHPPHSEPGEG